MKTKKESSERYWQNWDYGDVAKKIDEYWLESEGDWRKTLVEDIKTEFGKKSTIFEAGCGTGLIFKEMLKKGVVTHDSYMGGDVSQKMLAIARERFSKVQFVNLDILKLDYESGSQQNVISIHVIQHLPHYEQAIKELLRITKKRLYICSWFSREAEDKLEFCRPSEQWDGQAFQNNVYSLSKFIKFVLENSGREIASLRVAHFFGANYSIAVGFNSPPED